MPVGALQVFGIVLSLGMGYMQTAFNPQAGVNIANWFLCALLLAGYVLLSTQFAKMIPAFSAVHIRSMSDLFSLNFVQDGVYWGCAQQEHQAREL